MLADVRFTQSGRVVVAHLTGEVDISNAESLRNAIGEATPNQSLALVFDLSDIDYLDSAGIQLIYRLRESLRTRGQRLLVVVPPESRSRDALVTAGALSALDVYETLDAAFEALEPGRLSPSEMG
jgi:anti-anti-sigma factor